MIPSLVGRELEARFESLLKTQYRVREDSGFAHLWNDFFKTPEQLIKGPYLQLPLPFRKSTDTSAMTRFAPAIAKLKFPPYLHQVKSFDRVQQFKSTLVATGTGSGKTECFTLPILAHCAKYANETGIRAILIYPMNALATDQAKRLAETICKNPGLNGVRVGLYIGEAKGKAGHKGTGKRWAEVGYDEATKSYHVITDREKILSAPPHILLTNYKMLDYLLLRPKEKHLWDYNKDPDVLKFIAVDELHTFDGAQAADLACLLRRLKERLRIPDENLCCIGTSATLGTSADSSVRIREYAEKVFSSSFPPESLITEDRLSFDEMVAEAKKVAAENNQDPPVIFDSPFARALFEELHNKTRTIRELAKALKSRAENELWDDVPETEDDAAGKILEYCAELSRIRAERGRDYPDVKVQYWLRELARMAAKVPLSEDPSDNEWHPELAFADDLEDPDRLTSKKVRYFPLDNCNACGATAWIGIRKHGQDDIIEGSRRQINDGYFGNNQDYLENLRFIYPVPDGVTVPEKEGVTVKLFCGKCRRLLSTEAKQCVCGHDHLIRVAVTQPDPSSFKTNHVTRRISYSAPCPFCDGEHSNSLMVGMRSATMLSTCISTITTSKENTDKKILTFSDNVQDTSQRAGFFGGRTWAATFRAHLAQYFASTGKAEIGYEEFIAGFPKYLEGLMPDTRDQLAELIPQDLKWLDSWRKLKGDNAPLPSEQTMKVFFARLRWQIALEFGCCQELGRTLNRTCVAKMSASLPDAGAPCWAAVADAVCNYSESTRVFAGAPEKVRECFLAMTERMIRNGAFDDGDSVLTSGILLNGSMGALNTFTHLKVPVYKTSRSDNVLVPGYSADKHLAKLAIVDPLDEKHGFPEAMSKAGFSLDEDSWAQLFAALEKAGLVKSFDFRGKLTFWYVPIRLLKIVSHPLASSGPAQLNPFRRQYLDGEIYRVNPAEHTGLLNRDEREELENRFKAEDSRRWDPNLISATPTLEMGVDIGDLSTVLLCSVPPNQSKFIQRTGRSGRTNGSALNITVASAKPHDLYFFRDPAEMISGNVNTPGVFLDASAILERQYLGFALSEWMLSVDDQSLPATIGRMFRAIDEKPEDTFPKNFIGWYEENCEDLMQRFHARLSSFNKVHTATTTALHNFACGDIYGKDGICGRLEEAVVSTRTSLKNYDQKQHDIRELRKKVEKDPGLTDQLRAERIESLDVEYKSYCTFIAKLKSQSVMGWLCDCVGLLPNYAFPEPGVALQTILWRREIKTDPPKYDKIEISRPASTGLRELVPGSTFYTHGHHMLIDQVDMQRYSDEEIESCKWRFCPECDHIEPVKNDMPANCPVCGADWSNNGQVRNLLPVRQFVSVKPDRDTLNDDNKDDRDAEYYECRKFFEKDLLGGAVESFSCGGEGVPFAFEYVPHLILREVNFGFRSPPGQGEEAAVVNGDQLTGEGFNVCRECNKAVPVRGNSSGKIQHVKTCKFEMAPQGEDESGQNDVKPPLNVSFYREYHTEALRIFAPFLGEANDTRVMSFMAAIELGLKEHYKGEVDHLGMEVQSLPLPGKSVRQYFLILYDLVPGGTGYIRQFAEGNKPQLLFDIFEDALKRLKECTCAGSPEKDGCYNCLYRYRNQSSRAALSRKEAIKILEELVLRKKSLKKEKSNTGMSFSTAGLIESELEKQFVLRLSSMASQAGGKLEDATVRGYVKGWRVTLPGAYKLGAEQVDREWEIVPQKNLAAADGVLVASRPDFLFYPVDPAGKTTAKAVAVFLDGWEYHQDIAADDIIKRTALMDAGYRVWSLSWDDVAQPVPGKMDVPPVPLWRTYLGEGEARSKNGARFYGDKGERAQAWHDEFNDKPQEIDRFVAYLQSSNDELFCKHARFESVLLMLMGCDKKEPEVKKFLPKAYADYLDGGAKAAVRETAFNAGMVVLSDKTSFGNIRPALAAALDDRFQLAKDSWQGFFAFVSYFQFLNQDLLAFTVKSKDDSFWMTLKTVHSEISGGGGADWDEAFAMADGDAFCTAALKAIKDACLPPPRMFEDVTIADGSVLASPWMHWPERKLMALPAEDLPAGGMKDGWSVLFIDTDASPEILADVLKESYNG